ncbi:TetR/AcrR family transcriptional regulator [Streptomyces sp. NPDC086023]|uniref:TetR/AcrR family transcriptional regulator n=1 Tax=Streptomyces sp. NPDC086023 TaxID=3365746 RepID=UPI0037D0B816
MARNPAAGPARRAGDHGHRGRLSRAIVLAAALELVDREGLSALSMRRLGAELGVEAMALYRYADGKDGLLDGLVEALYTELEQGIDQAPAVPEADWRAGLHTVALHTYRACLGHPHVVPLLATRMLAVPLAQRPVAVLASHERVLALLRKAGFGPVESAALFRAVTAWILGYVAVELGAVVDNPAEPDPSFRLGLHRMPAHDLPTLREITPVLAERGGGVGLLAGLDALLDRFGSGQP